MQTSLFKRIRWGLALTLGALLIGALPRGSAPAARAAGSGESGIACTTSSSPNPSFSLTATEGSIGVPDGNIVYMWSYASGSGDFQHPGPVLCVNQNDTVTIVLHNNLPRPTSLVFPGQADVQADGAADQPQFDSGGALTSLAKTAAPNGGSVTYSFVASQPGTYLYESGTEPGLQVQMGLFGALVVRPSMGAGYAYNRADSQFSLNNEYIELFSEIDPILHHAVDVNVHKNPPAAISFNMVNYVPRYFLINGRGFPDTIAPNNASWLPDQPYGSLTHIQPYSSSTNPQPALVRYLNVGTTDVPFHPHGNHSKIIGRDGQPYAGPGGEDLSSDEFSIPVGSGQTWDATFVWSDAESWNPNSKPIDSVVTVPRDQNLTFGPYYGSPYLGTLDSKPAGTENQNVCGEYYHIAHNHNLTQIAGWGITAIGQITYTRIDPPGGCP